MAAPVEEAVAVAAAVAMEIWSLRASQAYALTLPDVPTSAPSTWRVVPDQLRVSSLARMDHLLLVGIHGHLRIIADHPHHPLYLGAFRQWT